MKIAGVSGGMRPRTPLRSGGLHACGRSSAGVLMPPCGGARPGMKPQAASSAESRRTQLFIASRYASPKGLLDFRHAAVVDAPPRGRIPMPAGTSPRPPARSFRVRPRRDAGSCRPSASGPFREHEVDHGLAVFHVRAFFTKHITRAPGSCLPPGSRTRSARRRRASRGRRRSRSRRGWESRPRGSARGRSASGRSGCCREVS